MSRPPVITNMISEEHADIISSELSKVIADNIEGDVVELGCNEGTASLVIESVLQTFAPAKVFHVYDSFQGLPKPTPHDENNLERKYVEGECKTEKEKLIENFNAWNLRVPSIHAGWFSEIPDSYYPARICFAFLDGDFYSSITDSLRKVYHKLTPGAVVCVHDYGWEVLPGVERAVTDFLRGKPEEGTVTRQNTIGIFKKL